MHEEGYRLICEFERSVGVPHIPRSMNEAAILYIRMMIAARLGHIDESLALAGRSRPFAMRHDGMASSFLIEQAAEALRVLGERDRERRMLDEAIERARAGNVSVNVGLALAEASFGSWFAGEDESFARYCADLEACVETDGVRGLWYYATVARGERECRLWA